MFEVIFAFGC